MSSLRPRCLRLLLHRLARLWPAIVVLGTLTRVQAASSETGPTPYPEVTAESAWPGKGPIRLFRWMPERRATFWEHRETDQVAVVFVGDSLTEGWKNLDTSFPHLKTANRGIGGDTSRGVLFRFQEDVLDLHPRAIVLCAGTNDLSAHADPADIADNLATMLKMARAQDPDVPIVLCNIPPRDVPEAPTVPGAQAELNDRIARLGAAQKNLIVLDLFHSMATPDGEPEPRYFGRDRIHMVPAGYARWAEVLRPVFEQLEIQ